MKNKLMKEFLHYTALNITSMLALSLYILADTFFVSMGCGATGLAALNLAIPVFNLITGCAQMIAIGGAIRYTIFKSRNAQEDQNRIFTHVAYLALVLSVIGMAIGIFGANGIAHMLGADEDTFSMTATYIRVLLIFTPFFMSADILNAFVRNDGQPRLAAIAASAGCLANVFFDYILIIILKMGMFGAVLATGFSPAFNLLILSTYFIKKKQHFHLKIQVPSAGTVLGFLPLGISSLVNEVSSGIVIIVFNLLILGLQGNTGVAAYGIIANISLVVAYIFTGVALGMQPLTSRFYGEGRPENVRLIFRYALILMLIISAGALLIIMPFAGPVASIFNSENDAKLQAIAIRGLHLYFLATPLMGFNIVLSTYFASIERALPSQIISIGRGLAILIPVAILMAHLLGMDGVWLSLAVTELIVALVGLVIFFRKKGL